jgi:hypothetical protein
VATSAAIGAASTAVLSLLESAAARTADFKTADFQLLTSSDLQGSTPETLAVSLYLYHVNVNVSRRPSPGTVDPLGERRLAPLPVDLHYLLIAWAKKADTQQRLLGWAVRTLHDTPTITSGVLNAREATAVFRPSESLELVWENLSQQDVFDIWEVARAKQQPSAAYVARIVELESDVVVEDLPLVQTTDFRYRPAPA